MRGLCEISSAALADASISLKFRPGQVIYHQGDHATGAYIVGSGKVKLVATSSVGKALTLRVAEPGEFIGLSAALVGCRNDTSAVVKETTEVNYVETESLYRLMSCFNDLSLRLAEQLSNEYCFLCRELSMLGLQRSAMSRLANLLVGLFEKLQLKHGGAKIRCLLTHEEMAQMIGMSRETVTRLFRDLREADIATLKHHTLQVNSLEKLCSLIQ
jgi:CRP/FNR family transcriptional regulator, cyclic AMP receptor protein